ncbi:MAG TPA: tetratricopeptide repeat protein, partial [bacterium]|nr:tetratricopeptide repeat protein [bacterium]
MRKVNVIAGLVLFFCTFIFAFDNYKQAYDSGMKKTEGFGEYDGAREDFNKAIALTNKATEKADAMFQIGETYYWQGNYNQAREEYSKIIKMDKLPSSYEAQSQLRIGDAFAAEKNYSQARQEYAKALGMQGKVAN